MLELYYDCVDKYLSREDFEYSEMDTDPAYMAISGDSVEAFIKPDLREEFENDKHNWFVTPRAPQGKRTPWLFKAEFEGDKIISLCSKSYYTEKICIGIISRSSQVLYERSEQKAVQKSCHTTNMSQTLKRTFVPAAPVSELKTRVW